MDRHRARLIKVARLMRQSETLRRQGLQRYRPRADPAFLDQLAKRLAAAARLPLALAQRRVKQFAVSAGAATDPGGDARWWKR
jgi:hypothetical protein